MKLSILGFPRTGKRTFFRILARAGSIPESPANKPVKGFAEISDPRFERLAELFSPRRQQSARIEINLLPDFAKEHLSDNRIIEHLRGTDVLCHVVRVFEDDSVFHEQGSVDPGRDIRSVESELIFNDMALLEKRLERINKESRSRRGEYSAELNLLNRLISHLEAEAPLRSVEIDKSAASMISSYPLLSIKPAVVVLNSGFSQLNGSLPTGALLEKFSGNKLHFFVIPLKREEELAEIDSEEEKSEFLQLFGIKMSACDSFKIDVLKTLGYISFFTTANGELRQWLAPSGTTAVEAAGKIHTDMAKGFIKAEIAGFNDISGLDSPDPGRLKAASSLKGRDHIISDGDIINVRFNV